MANEHVFRQAEARKKPVALSAEEAQDAARLISRLLKDDPRGNSSLERDVHSIHGMLSPPSTSAERNSTVQLARRTFLARRARGRFFVGGAMFGEPAWDMLLALYITESSERQSVTNLVGLSGVPSTTALRWIDHLVDQGFASRRPHMTDRRMCFIEITDKGRERLDAYFSTLLEKGFADL